MTPRPVDLASVQAKLRSLDELVGALRLAGEVDAARLQQDVLLRLAVERALTQSVDQVVAVCSHVLAAETTTVPTTYRDAVRAAAEHGLITDDLARSLAADCATFSCTSTPERTCRSSPRPCPQPSGTWRSSSGRSRTGFSTERDPSRWHRHRRARALNGWGPKAGRFRAPGVQRSPEA